MSYGSRNDPPETFSTFVSSREMFGSLNGRPLMVAAVEGDTSDPQKAAE
jgi:hypothetical protein